VVIRMQYVVISLGLPQLLQGDIGDHFIRVHVGGRARTALNNVNYKFAVMFASDQIVASKHDGICPFFGEDAHFQIGTGRGFLHVG
jgi:hypothetical protein